MTDLNVTTKLAKKIVEHIASIEFHYQPKRGIGARPARSWPDRLRGYRWRYAADPFSDFTELARIEDNLTSRCAKLLNNEIWTESDKRDVVKATEDLFAWGGVLRGQGHRDPCPLTIERVMRTALDFQDCHDAPLDSAWTKLAAMSTAGMEYPQVIFDSRVSVSLLRTIDAVCRADKSFFSIRNALRDKGLGFVPGRGGNRIKYVEELKGSGWKCGYGKWAAQFAASKLVGQMVDVLNESPRFGSMPLPSGTAGQWTIRGVEMVLFMDGY